MMSCSVPQEPNAFYLACCRNDLNIIQQTADRDEIDLKGPDGNTPLHAASMHGHVKVVRFLLRYHASRTIRNSNGSTAEELASNEETKAAFNDPIRTILNKNHFIASSREVEWVDSYENAYRISYENHEHMKRWLMKIPLHKLLNVLVAHYINNLKFPDEKTHEQIKEYLNYTIDYDNPLGLLYAYTCPIVKFSYMLNINLAELGSDFRFANTRALIDSGYTDNEPTPGLGPYIFASIIINHPEFRQYQYAGITFRGMKITTKDLEEYDCSNIVMTRSFLSTSKNRFIAELFLDCESYKTHPPVICIYKVINPRSSLAIETISKVKDEEEVLIIPFTVFEVKERHNTHLSQRGHTYTVTVITLEECVVTV
ncbi:unnamed protein product [Rotaria magnacalcarata]|uniref:NAD(+)--protein-arginine ADP-ribosyltransferase n=3 Tax=Rotaria magnacalcarata TaxID=392030 RepID=A0A816H0S2_9BILA|nr:unnamed protein product [Rotaria magnacalcarata]CAF4367608.1 unnamed protein product [Rotaria magnacalcarata]CAF4398844.1 unnamed protein product [Rotaria magnacalcarata]